MTEAQPLQATLTQLITENFEPSYLDVLNESHMHNVPANSETHFKLTCVSAVFEGLRAVQRHQKVYGVLQPCFEAGMHALALHLYTPEEWSPDHDSPASPPCMGGETRS